MKKRFTFILTLTALLCLGTGNVWGETLGPLYDGTNSYGSYVPLEGNNADRFQRVQVIYPKADLAAMKGKQITKMTFYIKTNASKDWNAPIQIRLAETSDDYFSTSSYKSGDWTVVYEGTSLSAKSGTTMEVVFNGDPFVYSGDKNLLFELLITAKTGSYASAAFNAKGGYDYNYSVYKYSTSGTSPLEIASGTGKPMRPKTLFTYEEAVAASCTKPKNLALTALRSTSATFSWTAGKDETSWQYVYLPTATTLTDAAWSSATSGMVNTTPSVTLSGLDAETNYKLYVRAYCSASDQSEEISKAFRTPCTEIASLDENFDDVTTYTIPECWSRIEYVLSDIHYPCVYTGGKEGNCMYFYGGASTSSSIIVLPPFSAATNSLVISFDYKNNSTSTSYGQGKIGYMTDPNDASTFTVLSNLPRKTTWTTIEEYALTGAPASSFIAVKFEGGSSAGRLYIDNLSVGLPSSCKKPSDLSVSALSPTSAKVSWTAQGEETAWNVRFSTDGNTWTTSAATTNPFTLTGLTASTSYQVQVQANCGSEQSKWTASQTVTTLCAPITGVGFSQNFDSETNSQLPGCWNKISSNSYPYTYAYYAKGCSGKCLYFSGGVTGTSELIAILPPFSEATNTLMVSLYYSNSSLECDGWYDRSGSAYGQVAIGYITDPSDASTFTAQELLPRVGAYTQAQVALTNAPVGSYVAIRYSGGSSSGEAFVDDIAITAIPSCVTPSGVAGSATDVDEATISWTRNGSETAWKIKYSSDNGETWSDEIAADANPFTLSGLSAQTTYIAQVKADCGGGEYSEWSASSLPFSTPCLAKTLPYAFDFESGEGAVNAAFPTSACWSRISSSSYPQVYNSGAKSGSQHLRFYGNGTQYAVLPQFAEDVKGMTMSFYYSNYSWGGTLSVGYMTDPTDASTFVELSALPAIYSYGEDPTELNLNAAAVGANYIAFKYVGTESYHYSYIDNIVVEKTLSCQKPTEVVASNMMATTADLAWTENNGATAWKVQYSTDGTNWTDANGGEEITSNPYTLIGLSASTTYYARVKSVCGGGDGESNWSAASASFKTACAVATLPFSDNFGGADLGCWEMNSCYASTGLYNGAFRFYYNSSYTDIPPQYLISPEIDTDGKPVTVEFDYYAESASWAETFHVGYSTTTKEVAAFTWGAEVTATNTSANTLRYSENLPAGVKFIAIKHTSDDKYYLYIDNFSVTEYIAPACPSVSAATLQESAVTAHTATVSWTAGNDETDWNLQYKAAGGEWSSIIPVATTPSHNLTSLAANTLYYVRVQADCGGDGTGDWTGDEAFSFRTDCEQQVVSDASPWNYGFEDAEDDHMPACWDRTEAYSNHGYPIVNEDSYNANNGDKYLYFYTPARNGGPAYTEDAILPVFNTEIKNLKVSFVYKNNSTATNYGQLAIGYVDPSNANAFTQVGELLAKEDDYTSVEREMPSDAPNGARIAIRCIGSTKSGYSTYVYVDDVVVSLKPSCYTPTELAAAATSNGAVITWTDDAASKWNLRYRQVAEPEVDWTPANNKTSGFALTGLTPNTEYEVQVQADCEGDGTSAWSASVTFTPVCNAPSALTVTARTQSSATFSWTSSESAWKLQYKAADAEWDAATEVPVNANPFTLTGLTAGTTYNAKIQAACGSAFTDAVEFTTWCDSKLSLPVELTSFSAIPACWEESPAGAISIAQSKLCFVGEGERFLYLPQTDINLNLLSVSLTFSGSLDLGYISEPNGAFTQIVASAESGTEYNLASLAPEAPKYLAIRYNGASSLAQSAISAISIRRTPSCSMPTDLAAGSITSSSASISWTAGGGESAWNLQYKKNGAADWNNVAVSTNPTHTLSDLAQGTNYKVRVQAACAGEDLSDWTDEIDFTTQCAGIASIPWDADFSANLSDCWTIHCESPEWYSPMISSEGLLIPGGNTGHSNVVVLPGFTPSLTPYTITLRYKCDNGAGHATPQIGYVTSKDNASTFAVLLDGTDAEIGTLEKPSGFKTVYLPLSALPAEASNLAIRYAGGSIEGDLIINEFRISHVEIFEDAEDADNVTRLVALNGQTLDAVFERPVLRNGDYNTLCLPFDLSAAQLADSKCPLNGFQIREYDHTDIDLNNDQVDIFLRTVSAVEAGKACFVRLEGGSLDRLTWADFRDVTISASEVTDVDDNAAGIHYIGIFNPHELLGNNSSNLYLSTNNALWIPKSNTTMKGFRAYFGVDAGGPASAPIRRGAQVRIVEHKDSATGVENVQNDKVQSTKILEGTQVIIIRNGVRYTIHGQKMN